VRSVDCDVSQENDHRLVSCRMQTTHLKPRTSWILYPSNMNALPPESYDAWLAMTDEEQERIKDDLWDAYSRDRIDVPFTALARLLASTDRTVIDGAVGTWHCGEYLLHVHVPPDEIADCPKPLEQRFEGFRVYWMCYAKLENHYADIIDVHDLPLNIQGQRVTINAKLVDLRVYVDAFDSSGQPLLVTHPRIYDGGFSFNLPDFHPDTDDTHILLPGEDGRWNHQYTVRRSLPRPDGG
ncbi:hypothetical protein LOC71_02625, partial [Rhodopirellula sp. JC740]